MSSVVLLMILAHIARFGTAPQPDEGTAAHVFQILMPAQLPIIVFFAITWLPRSRMPALAVLAVQGAAIAAILSIVFLLRW